jgi:predicted DNA-binding transcriptional regulator AlpA
MNSLKTSARKKLQQIESSTEQSDIGIKSPLLTEAEAALYLKVSRSALAKARCEGTHDGRTEMPKYTRIGGRIRYFQSECDRWLADLKLYANLAEEGGTING